MHQLQLFFTVSVLPPVESFERARCCTTTIPGVTGVPPVQKRSNMNKTISVKKCEQNSTLFNAPIPAT